MLHPTYIQKASEYDQEIPQSHTKDQPTAPCGRATKQYINNNNKTTTLEQTVAQATGGGGGGGERGRLKCILLAPNLRPRFCCLILIEWMSSVICMLLEHCMRYRTFVQQKYCCHVSQFYEEIMVEVYTNVISVAFSVVNNRQNNVNSTFLWHYTYLEWIYYTWANAWGFWY